MNYTESYQQIVDHEGEREDYVSRLREALALKVEEKLLAGKKYFDFDFDDLIEYMSQDGYRAWCKWTRKMLNGKAAREDHAVLRQYITEAAEEIADDIIKRNPGDVVREEL